MPLTITNTLVNGNVVDAPQLNTNFGDIKDALDGTDNVDITIKNNHAANPPLTINETSTADIFKAQKNGVDIVSIENNGQIKSVVATGVAPIAVDSITLCANLNADLLDGKHAIEWKISAAPSFTINDPSIANLNSREFGSIVIPPGGSYTITRTAVMYRNGSHAAGSTLTFKIDIAFVGDISTLVLNDTNNLPATLYFDDIVDIPVAAGTVINAYQSGRTGTNNERDVSIIVELTRTLF